MSGKVFALAAPNAPDPVLVELLTQLLDDARSGQLCALVGLAEYHSGHVDQITCGPIDEFSTAGHLQALVLTVLNEDE